MMASHGRGAGFILPLMCIFLLVCVEAVNSTYEETHSPYGHHDWDDDDWRRPYAMGGAGLFLCVLVVCVLVCVVAALSDQEEWEQRRRWRWSQGSPSSVQPAPQQYRPPPQYRPPAYNPQYPSPPSYRPLPQYPEQPDGYYAESLFRPGPATAGVGDPLRLPGFTRVQPPWRVVVGKGYSPVATREEESG